MQESRKFCLACSRMNMLILDGIAERPMNNEKTDNEGRLMESSKLNRINELARLAKERALTPEELAERDTLRKEYIAEWRRGAEQVLENTYIIGPDGKKRKLQKKQ